MPSYAIIAALLYTLSFIISDSLSKKFILRIGAFKTGAIIMGFGIIPALLSLVFVNLGSYSDYAIGLSIIAGVLVAFGYAYFCKVIETEQIANSMAFSELGSVVFVVFGFIVLGEPISNFGIVGIGIVFLGAALLATTRNMRFNKKLLPAMYAYIIWTTAFIIFTYAIKSSGAFAIPIIVMKITAFVAFFFAARMVGFRNTHFGARMDLKSVASVGFVDGLGSVGFGAAVMLSAIGLTGVINALVPVIAALIGLTYYKEKFTNTQLVGFVIIIMGALIVSSA